MENNERVLELERELAKLRAENANLQGQLDAQNKGFDVQAALDRIKAENESNKAYQAEMQAQFDRLYKRDEKKDTPPQTTRYY